MTREFVALNWTKKKITCKYVCMYIFRRKNTKKKYEVDTQFLCCIFLYIHNDGHAGWRDPLYSPMNCMSYNEKKNNQITVCVEFNTKKMNWYRVFCLLLVNKQKFKLFWCDSTVYSIFFFHFTPSSLTLERHQTSLKKSVHVHEKKSVLKGVVVVRF